MKTVSILTANEESLVLITNGPVNIIANLAGVLITLLRYSYEEKISNFFVYLSHVMFNVFQPAAIDDLLPMPKIPPHEIPIDMEPETKPDDSENKKPSS